MKLAGKFDTIIASPLLEMWTELRLPMDIISLGPVYMPMLQNVDAPSRTAAFVSMDVSGSPSLTVVTGAGSPGLVDVRLARCPLLATVRLMHTALPTPAVDQVLADLVGNGTLGGLCLIYGMNVGLPSNPDGLALKAILVGRGWTMVTN